MDVTDVRRQINELNASLSTARSEGRAKAVEQARAVLAAFSEYVQRVIEAVTELCERLAETIRQVVKSFIEHCHLVCFAACRWSLYRRLRRWPSPSLGLPAWLAEFIARYCPERWLPAFEFP